MDTRGKQIAKQGAILALASFIVRFIGVLYRIPMANILGDEGMGYYSNAFNIYMYLLIISSYAMPTAISRIVSERLVKKERKEAHFIFKASILLNILISSFFSVLLFYLAKPYAQMIKMPGAEPAIKSLAPSLVIFAVMSSFRGYFQGMHTMVPTAVSQILEQIFNAIFSIVLSYFLMKKGVTFAAAGGTIGTGIGALMGLLFLIMIYSFYRQRLPRNLTHGTPLRGAAIPHYWKIILLTSIPMVIGTATFNISTIIDDAMFANALYFHSYSFEQISTLSGILNGKYTIIITMPIAIAAAVATTGVPSISASVAIGDREAMCDKIKFSLKGIMLIAMPAFIGIFVLANPILKLMFDLGNFEKVTTDILKIGSITVLFFSISTLSIGILQGLGHVGIPVRSAVKSIAIKTCFNFIVFYAFNLNLYGAALANIVFSMVSAYFNLSAVIRKTKICFSVRELVGKPLAASVLMGLITMAVYYGLSAFFPVGYWGNFISTVFSIAIAMISYFILILKLKAISPEEIKEMPFGSRLCRLAKRFV